MTTTMKVVSATVAAALVGAVVYSSSALKDKDYATDALKVCSNGQPPPCPK